MCTGFEIAALGALAVGTTATLYAQDTQQNYDEAVADFNAKQADADAAAAEGAAQVEAARIRKQAERQRASAVAAAAAAGVDVNSPTALRIDENITKDAEEDAVMTIFNARDTANRMRTGAQGTRIDAKASRTASNIAKANTLLGGASRAVNYGGDAWKRARAGETG